MASSSVSISALPAELVVFVADNLDSLKDLSSLALVDRKFYSTVNAILYKRATARGDAWPLAWAAHCGMAGTLRKTLAAGANPNHQFADGLPLEKWKKKSAAAKLATHENDNEVWDTDNECDSDMEEEWSPETEDTDHAATVTTNQPSSNSTSETWGHNAFDDSDRDVSDVSMDENPYVVHGDDDSSTLDELEDEDDVYDPYGLSVRRSFSPIHLAARGGHNDIIEILLEHGANVNVPCQSLCDCSRLYGLLNSVECPERDAHPPSWSPLHVALCHSHPETAKLLLSRGASHMIELDANPSNNGTSTALHQAAAMGLVDVVKYILDQGIQTEVDVRDDKTLTPFYHAYAHRRWDSTVPLLLERGANINVEIKMFIPYTTITPLGESCRLGNFDVVDKLLDLGADPNYGFIATSTGGGLSPLHMCCMLSAKSPGWKQRRLFEEEEMGARRMKSIEKLVAHGALVETTDCTGDTPLMLATQNRNLPAIKAIIKVGADVHQRNGHGRNAVMQTILGPTGHSPDPPDGYVNTVASVLRELFNNGARLDERDSDGNTVLHLVFQGRKQDRRDQIETLRILLNRPEASSLLQVRNANGCTPLQVAFMDASNIEACEILVRRGCLRGEPGPDIDELATMFGCTHNFDLNDQEKVVDFILDLDSNGVATSNSRLFHGLLAGSHYIGARLIWRRGLPPIPPTELRELLFLALRVSEYDLAFSLLEAGADIQGDPGGRRSPLLALVEQHIRCDSNTYQQFLEALLDRGANIHLPVADGSPQRVLNKVITRDMSESLELMLKKQPLLNDPRAVGGCYLHDAVTIPSIQHPPNERIIDMLLASGASISELNNDGDTPLSVLLKSLCKHRSFTWRYHRYIKRLFGPEVDINRRNTEGRSIADYLETLMQKSSQPNQTTFLTRRIQLLDSGNGRKALNFLPRPHKRVKPSNIMGRAG